jgi:signal transduction histidine kinase
MPGGGSKRGSEGSDDDPARERRPDGVTPVESLFEATTDPAVAYVREDGEFLATAANVAFHDVFDPAEPVAGRELGSALVTGDAGPFVDELDGGTPRTVVHHPANADREFLLRAVPADAEGGAVGGYAIYTEITDQRERIRELEAGIDRLDQLVSVVVHDLRNPLEIAEIRLELARETGENEHFEKVASAHERIGDLVDELRETARDWDEIGVTESLDLEAAVKTAWEGVATEEATLEIVGTPGELAADPDRLRRLLENLFRNAVDHGGPSVRVRVGTLGDGAGFYVEDDGPGIPPENRTEVFEAGFSTRSGGDGLGLAIVEGIASAHGWTVSIAESEAGGARFEIRARDDC